MQMTCTKRPIRLYGGVRGWRGRVPRQPGQVRKEAATTSPTWVDVQLSPTQTPYLEDYHDYFLDPLGRDALKSFHFPRRFAAAHDACQVIKLAREIQ